MDKTSASVVSRTDVAHPMYQGAMKIVHRLVERGYRAVFAGGCVRDFLMGRFPDDIDIATDATPDDVVPLFAKASLVGASFGVVKVFAPPYTYDVATFRVEGPYHDGRHPSEVRFATEQEDARRRDFTINGMFYDPVRDELLDYVGGREDLARRVVRAIGDPDRRFDEDKLRMVRAVRFAARDAFTMDPTTIDACRHRADQVLETSSERIGIELDRILTQGNADRAVALLDDTGLLEHILPEIAALRGIDQPRGHPEGDVYVHTVVMLGFMGKAPIEVALGALLHDIGKAPTVQHTDRIRFPHHCKVGAEMARQVCNRLRYPKRLTHIVSAITREHMRFKDVMHMRQSTLKRFLREPYFGHLLEVHRLDCLASHGDLTAWEFCAAHLAGLTEEETRPQPLITGTDLIELGYTPGPRFRTILAAVEDAWLEGTLDSADRARRFVLDRFPREPGTLTDGPGA